MKQNYLETFREKNSQRKVVTSKKHWNPSNNIQVKDKASIKNLIRVAASRK